jgi:transposase
VNTIEEQVPVGRRRRRQYSKEFKARAVADCQGPGVSIAAIALHHQLNANLLRRWVEQSEGKTEARLSGKSKIVEPVPSASFVPVPLSSAMQAAAQDIVVEVRRGTTAVTLRWPVSAAKDCAQWLQGWLR